VTTSAAGRGRRVQLELLRAAVDQLALAAAGAGERDDGALYAERGHQRGGRSTRSRSSAIVGASIAWAKAAIAINQSSRATIA
jgi:hypothetical protein